MYAQLSAIIIALAATPLVSAHGEILSAVGDLGGNGTALGIKGAVVPGEGPNYETEVQTTVFWSKDINTDYDLGFTEGGVAGNGNNQLDYVQYSMAQSGSTLPQVSSGGSVSGVFHVVTDDGCGPLQAVVDPTATSLFSKAVDAQVTSNVPTTGTAGECPTSLDSGVDNKIKRTLRRALVKMGLLSKRANNVDKSYSYSVEIPAGTVCSGTINGMTGLCLVKVSNNNANGPFGGVVVVQMPNSTTAARTKRSTSFTA
ncbi:hypothetical protein M406DRAFT_354816 [Cryphonectria parasitica EP155]|uniref:Cell surface protein n=1 Tax=Cryphonectria parasitica (strain ATCC 38755 / EP155) TaxID=660469 RepID=A0A9P4YDE1_CRYP1|nr:uncharacterized protein M406DRAFT_354816 [Cryphonectria parasitica EP155]KAF3771331.1 hypothetical protein M406DRAFT_354816 [Cryphonectria parasitica EP155]